MLNIPIMSIRYMFIRIFFMIFLFSGLALWLGNVLDSRPAGFFIVAGFFLLILILVFALRKKVIVPLIRNAIISKVYE